jgi:hypothetical protein
MKKSRLAGFIIDCQGGELESAAHFWSQALHMPAETRDEEQYIRLDSGDLGLHIEVQKVDHASRVHLDILARDVAAEVQRLETLGARCIERFPNWQVMEAPTGQRFCVVQDKDED